MKFVILLVICVVSVTNAGKCGDECTDPDTGFKYPSDMVWTSSKKCILYGCKKTNGNVQITTEGTCPQYKLKEGCTLTPEDLTKNYPDCCPQPKCP